ncbi:Uncharacterised protein [Enterobacter cloacae]|nr:Uncharacterised protein [Enterobacter cloacae]
MIKSIKLDNGKEYRLFTSRMEVEVKTSRIHAETGYPIWMRVNGPRVISQVIAAIADVDHTEALDMNAAIEWARITPEQRTIHAARVTYGISLKNKYNTDDVLEACHAEALEMDASREKQMNFVESYTKTKQYNEFDIIDVTEALNMDAARELNARQARFVFHNTAGERAEAIEAAHAVALKIDANMKI